MFIKNLVVYIMQYPERIIKKVTIYSLLLFAIYI